MARLSSKKLNELKELYFLTNDDISTLTGIPKFIVDTLFSDRNHHPTMSMVLALMELFSCDMKDLFDYEEGEFDGYELISKNLKMTVADIL